MASNGLVGNPSKTVLMIMGDNTITKKLLGMDVDSNQKWKTH
jgi:hypothetical protein